MEVLTSQIEENPEKNVVHPLSLYRSTRPEKLLHHNPAERGTTFFLDDGRGVLNPFPSQKNKIYYILNPSVLPPRRECGAKPVNPKSSACKNVFF